MTTHSFFKETFNSCFEKVVGYIFSYCRDREVAKNIAQDVFIVFWENIDKIEKNKTPLPYLLVIAKNKTLNMLERDMVRLKHCNYVKWREFELRYRALESSTMNEVLAKDVERLVVDSMNEMSLKVRETFYLSRFRNMKNEEIAKELRVSVKTVEYRMSSALRTLKKHLSELIVVMLIIMKSLYG